ncbi:MAG: hypothetical protein GC161_07615 [Planctomycetaceae bacterium]|nr:hypothetical protein [Planctomycetaceae bacterium]
MAVLVLGVVWIACAERDGHRPSVQPEIPAAPDEPTANDGRDEHRPDRRVAADSASSERTSAPEASATHAARLRSAPVHILAVDENGSVPTTGRVWLRAHRIVATRKSEVPSSSHEVWMPSLDPTMDPYTIPTTRVVELVDGRAEVQGLEPGMWSLGLVPGTLPRGWLPARLGCVRTHGPGGALLDVLLEPRDEPLVATLPLVRSALVYGVVIGPAGHGVPYATLDAMPLPPNPMRGSPLRFDADPVGQYEVELWPGHWTFRAFAGPSEYPPPDGVHRPWPSESPIYGRTSPRPRRIELAAGETREWNFDFRGGTGSIEGRLQCDEGRPFSGLRVMLCPDWNEAEQAEGWVILGRGGAVAADVTDADGNFAFEHLGSGPYYLMVADSEYEVRAPPGANVLADWPSKFPLRLGPGESKRGVVLVEQRSRPMVVEGHILLGPLSLAGGGVEYELVYPAGFRGRTSPNVHRFEVDRAGAFRWHCETPEGPMVMRVVQRGAVLHEETIDAVPDGRFLRTIRLP